MKKLRGLFLVGLLAASYATAFIACEEDPMLTNEEAEQTPGSENPSLPNGKTALYKPVAVDSLLEYSGSKRHITIAPFIDTLMTAVGDTGLNAGRYTALVALKDTLAYCWRDGNTDTLRLAWRITRKALLKPSAAITQHVYDNDGDTLVLDYFDGDLMTISGNTAAIVGEHECTITLKDTENYMWTDGTDTDVVIPWKITAEGKTLLKKPYTHLSTWAENNSAIPRTMYVSGFDEKTMRIVGDNTYATSGIVLRFYIALKDTANYAWEDGSVDSVAVRYDIHRYITEYYAASYTLSEIMYSHTEKYLSTEPMVLTHDQLLLYSEKVAATYGYIKDKTFRVQGAGLVYDDMSVIYHIDGYYTDDATELAVFPDNRIITWTWPSELMEGFHPMAQLVFKNLFLIDGKIHFVYTEWEDENGQWQVEKEPWQNSFQNKKEFTFIFSPTTE